MRQRWLEVIGDEEMDGAAKNGRTCTGRREALRLPLLLLLRLGESDWRLRGED